MKAERFLESMRKRFACKRFRKDFPLSFDAIEFLLECGRLSPSSFGLEPWRFVVAANPETIKALGDACFSQDAVYTSPCVIVILARKDAAYSLDSAFLRQRAERFPGGYPVFEADYKGYHEFLLKENRILYWARAQTYIACANMMTGAASLDLDSCPLEGFDEAGVLSALDKSEKDWTVGIVVAFGRRDEDIRPKIREKLSNMYEIV
ncbi:MAG TPA: NAD(P)H-dependent oxidoreductase [Rectinemataceae bacterium]|nr:NAD(P)H-dependent oxidoreductase [Rectinemataceae bacterium]